LSGESAVVGRRSDQVSEGCDRPCTETSNVAHFVHNCGRSVQHFRLTADEGKRRLGPQNTRYRTSAGHELRERFELPTFFRVFSVFRVDTSIAGFLPLPARHAHAKGTLTARFREVGVGAACLEGAGTSE
jgi:hypothetical protein